MIGRLIERVTADPAAPPGRGARAMTTEPDVGHAVGDARKRLLRSDGFDFDEQRAHLDVDPLLWEGDEA